MKLKNLCSDENTDFIFVHDLAKLQNGDFRLFGTLVALALISGCAGPRYFMSCVRVENAFETCNHVFN